MPLDENEINAYLQPLFGKYEDSFQDAWVGILEGKPDTVDEIAPIARKVKSRAIKRYLEKKYREDSLQKPLGNGGDERFTLESILASPTDDAGDEPDEGNNRIYRKMVDFLIEEYLKQRTENLELRRKEVEIKAQKLRLREELLKFKKERFESWRRLMEEKGRQKQTRFMMKMQFQRERLELQRDQLSFKERARAGKRDIH